RFSPDGTQVAFESAMARERFYYTNGYVAVVPRAGGAPANLTQSFDEDVSLAGWGRNGIWLAAGQKTEAGLFRLDPVTKTVTRVPLESTPVAFGFSFDRGFDKVAYVGSSPSAYPEACLAATRGGAVARLSTLTEQLRDFTLGTG